MVAAPLDRGAATGGAITLRVIVVVLAMSIIATMRVLGVTLIAATLVVPPVVARMVTHVDAVVILREVRCLDAVELDHLLIAATDDEHAWTLPRSEVDNGSHLY